MQKSKYSQPQPHWDSFRSPTKMFLMGLWVVYRGCDPLLWDSGEYIGFAIHNMFTDGSRDYGS